MNTKELAKLLLKHPLIKKINESQVWDRSIVSRVIAEELLNEQEDIEAQIEKLKAEIRAARKTIKDLKYDFDELEDEDIGKELAIEQERQKERMQQLNNLQSAQKELAKEVPTPAPRETTSAEKELSRDELVGEIDTINSTLANFKKETPFTKDLKAKLSAAQEKLKAIDKTSKAVTDKAIESNKPEVKKFAKALNQDTTEKVAQANKKIEAAKESPPKVKASEIEKAVEEIPTEPLKKATEKIVKSEPQPEPQPEPISEPIPYQIKWKSLGDSYVRKAKAKLSDVRYAYLKQLIDIYEKKDIDSWKQRHPKIAEKTTDDQIVAFLEQNADRLAKKYADFFKEYEAALESKSKEAVEKVEDEIEQQEGQEETTAFQLVTPEDQVDEKAERYREIGEELLKGEKFQGLKLAQNPLFQIYAAFWLSKETGQEMRVDELNLKGILNNRIEEFTGENLLSPKQQEEFLNTIKNEMDSFKNLLGALKKFSGSIDDDEEEKEKLLPQVIKAADEEVPPVPDLQKLSQVKFQDFLIDLLSKGLPLKADDEIIDVTPEDEEETKLLTGPVQEEEAQEEAQEDIQPERETPPQVFSEQHYTTLATFFADEGARGLGFMQQLLLRRQSEQLYGLIETLNELIDPTGGEEAALTREVLGEQQEENTTEQGMELEPSEKRKLKSELLGLLSALRSLKTLSKAYEENLTRTSVDPRYDGSSLKKRLDAMLPDIQDSIARILKMIKDFLAELPKVEPMGSEEVVQEQEGKGLDREAKIDLVDDTYKEMRKMWPVLKSALQEQTEKPEEENIEEQEDASKATETVVSTAREMRELASSKPFIDFFPTITFSQEGQVVSINQANNVLSGVISQFVYVMRNVVALVKGEELTEGTAIEVQDKLVSISNAIEKSFGVPASKVVRQVEKEISEKPSEQSLTDTPANNNEFFDDDASTVDPEIEIEFDDEDEREDPEEPISTEDIPKSLSPLVAQDTLNKMGDLPEDQKESLEFYFGFLMDLVDENPEPEEMLEEFVDRIFVGRRVKTVLKNNNIDYPSLQVSEIKGLMKAEEALKGLLDDEKFRIDKHLDSFLGDLVEDNKEEVENILSKILKKLEPKEKEIREALKPIIAKMLKEHHG